MAFITNDILLDSLGIFVALLAVLFVFIKRRYRYWEYRNIPYLPPSIPWGNLEPPHKRAVSVGEDVSNIYAAAKKKGWKYVGVYSLTGPVFMPLDLELVKNIMTKDFNHFSDRGWYVNERDEPMGAHLFALGGKKWKNLRTKLSPTFTSGKMKNMFETVANCGISLEKYLQELNPQEPVDIKQILMCYSTDIIGSCAFGLECNTFKEPDTPFMHYGREVFQLSTFRNLMLVFGLSFPNVARFLRVRLNPKEVEDFYTKVVNDTVRYREKENVRRLDFLQMLIDIKNENNEYSGDGTSLTMDEIVAQCFVFFVAGFETSSTTMTFALYLLATRPEIQDKVRNEIKSVLEKHNNRITYDALNDLKYLGQVIDETLRLYPSVPMVTRQCVEDYKVPNSDVIIEKDTLVFISIRGIQYDPEYFKNPEVFDPDRFSEENKKVRHPYAHIPFGEGPRICIGMRFGVMQTKVGLVSILRNFRVRLSSKTEVPLKMSANSLVTATEDKIWLELERIK